LLVLAGSEFISLFHLPQDALRDIGIVLLIVVGCSYLFPPLAALIERPFARIRTRQPSRATGGLVLGLALGLVFVPCAGPILAAITVVGATHHVGITAILVTLAFGVGAAIPLFVLAVAGDGVAQRVGVLRRNAPTVRRVGGVVLIAMAIAIWSNAFDGLQRLV